MARRREQVFALVGAVLFLGTSLGASGLVIWQNHKDQQATQAATKAAADQSTKQEATMDNGNLKDFTPISKIDKLQRIDKVVGTGDEVKSGDTITAKYTGAYASDGVVFDSSDFHGGSATFSLSGVIPGWSNSIPGMRVGGKSRLLIPYNQAYEAPGVSRPQGFRENADLVFDVEIISIHK